MELPFDPRFFTRGMAKLNFGGKNYIKIKRLNQITILFAPKLCACYLVIKVGNLVPLELHGKKHSLCRLRVSVPARRSRGVKGITPLHHGYTQEGKRCAKEAPLFTGNRHSEELFLWLKFVCFFSLNIFFVTINNDWSMISTISRVMYPGILVGSGFNLIILIQNLHL